MNYLLISDSTIQIMNSCMIIDLRLCENIIMEKQECVMVKTQIIIDGPIFNFNMLIKKHISQPCCAILKHEGFIHPNKTKYEDLFLKLYNPCNYSIKLSENDVIGVLVLTEYTF